MSRGRRGFSLEGLQAAVESSPGMALAVARELLGDPEAPVVVRERWQSREDLLLSGDVDQDAYGKPADWAHRMTPGEIRREVADLMRSRAPEWAEWVWPLLRRDYDAVPTAVLSPLSALEGRCVREVRSTLAKTPGKRKPVDRMPVRTEGPCSEVVVRTRSGALYDGNGVPITAERAAEILATPVVPE